MGSKHSSGCDEHWAENAMSHRWLEERTGAVSHSVQVKKS